MKVRRERVTLEMCQTLAKERGGKCLSTAYKNGRTSLLWKCKEGHEFKKGFESVSKYRTWCDECDCLRKLIECHEFAEKKGGKCLSTTYVNKKKEKMEWKCGVDDHPSWKTIWASIERGTWCQFCAFPGYGYTLQTVQEYAESKGGKCLSTEYLSPSERMEFECVAGHRFRNCYQNMRNRGDWCRVCAGYQILDLDFCHQIAVLRKGKCLSTVYDNKETKMEWECEHGHRWWASFGKIYHVGQWCRYCVNKTEAKVYEFLKDLLGDDENVLRQFKPEWLLNEETGCYFSFDFVLEKFRIVIEVDGRQHFEKVLFFGGKTADVEKNVERDVEKMVKAMDHKYRVIRLFQEDVWEEKTPWREWLLEQILIIEDDDDGCGRVSFPEKEEYCVHKELLEAKKPGSVK
jgi:hypothetical protein